MPRSVREAKSVMWCCRCRPQAAGPRAQAVCPGVGEVLWAQGLCGRHRQVLQHQALLSQDSLHRGPGALQQPARPLRRPADGQAAAQALTLAAKENSQNVARQPRQQHAERRQCRKSFRGYCPLRLDSSASWRTEIASSHEEARECRQHTASGGDGAL